MQLRAEVGFLVEAVAELVGALLDARLALVEDDAAHRSFGGQAELVADRSCDQFRDFWLGHGVPP